MKNAQSLVRKNAAVMITENKLDSRALLLQADKIMENKDLRTKMADASRKIGHPQAADELIAVLHKAINEH